MLVDTSHANKGGDEMVTTGVGLLYLNSSPSCLATEGNNAEKKRKNLIETLNLVNQLKIRSLLQSAMSQLETTLSCSPVQILLPHYRQTIQMANAVSTNCQQLSQKLTCVLIQINLVTNYT